MINRLRWDSDFFGISVGSACWVMGDVMAAERFMSEISKNGFDLIYAKVPLEAYDVIETLIRSGRAATIDFRAKMVRDLDVQCLGSQADLNGEHEIREAVTADVHAVGQLASVCFRGKTRFYRDPGIDDGRCDEFYRTWAEKDVRTEDVLSIVAGSKGGVYGFCNAKIEGNVARIGLYGVAAGRRGEGIGRQLLEYAAKSLMEKGVDRLSAVTQLISASSVRAYERAEFLVRDVGVIIHIWAHRENMNS